MRARRPWRAMLLALACAATVGAGAPAPSGLAGPPPWPDGSEVALVLISTDAGEANRFEPSSPTTSAAGATRITFENRSNQQHNLVFTGPIRATSIAIVQPGSAAAVQLVTPGPGRYPFTCTIHIDMTGTLVVG